MASGISITRSQTVGIDKGLLLEILHIVDAEVKNTKNPMFWKCDLRNLEFRLTTEILKRWNGGTKS